MLYVHVRNWNWQLSVQCKHDHGLNMRESCLSQGLGIKKYKRYAIRRLLKHIENHIFNYVTDDALQTQNRCWTNADDKRLNNVYISMWRWSTCILKGTKIPTLFSRSAQISDAHTRSRWPVQQTLVFVNARHFHFERFADQRCWSLVEFQVERFQVLQKSGLTTTMGED